jgi:hypothetical protein
MVQTDAKRAELDRVADHLELRASSVLGRRTEVRRWTYHVVRGSVAVLGVRPLRVVRAGSTVASTAGDLVVLEDAEVLAVPRRLEEALLAGVPAVAPVAPVGQSVPAVAASRWSTNPACCVDALRPLVLGIR